MKTTIKILVILFLTTCSTAKKRSETPLRMNTESIDKVYIRKDLYGKDSVELSKDQIELLVNKWNNAESKGLYKMIPKFWITVKLNNDSVRNFRVNKDLIKEHGDWTFSIGDSIIDSFWKPTYPFPKPEDYTPLTFLNFISQTPNDSTTLRLGMAMINGFPVDWVKEEHLEKLFQLLDSKEKCGCFLNPLSSYIPSEKAEKGGYAGIFVKSFKDGKKVDLGLYSCPKVDEELNSELKRWWNKRKQ